MAAGSNGRRLFTVGRNGRQSAEAQAVAAPPAAPVPGQPVERVAPANEVYLDPDVEGGRSRIVIMLSEDKTVIEPVLRIKMHDLQYASVLAQQSELVMQEVVLQRMIQERQISQLSAEVEFLREQVRKGAQPPPSGVVPPPFAAAHHEGGA